MSDGNGELPEGWAIVPIGNLCDLINGRAFKPTEWTTSGLPIIRIQNLNNHHAKFNHFNGEYADQHLVRTGDLLFAWSGTPGTSFGAHVWHGEEALLNQHIFRVLIDEEDLHKTYFRFAINHKLEELIGKAHGGVGLRHVTKGKFQATEVPLPPLAEQRRIVSKIESLQERSSRARESLSELGPLLEQFRQSVLRAAFSGRLTADWRAAHPNVEPASELLARIRTERRHRWEQSELTKYEAKGKQPPKGWKDKYEEPHSVDEGELPEVPKGWCWTRAEEVCEYITKGTTPPKDKMTQDCGEVRFLKVGNLTFTGALDFAKENAYIDNETHNAGVYSRSRIYPGDVLMNLVGPPLGKVSLIPPEIEQSNVNQAIAIFRPIDGLRGRYLTLALTTPSILERIISRARQTSGQRNLTLDLSRGLPLPVAPYEEQAEIVRRAQVSLDLIDGLKTMLAGSQFALTQLDQSILAKAFRGELVPQDPSDEPASVLLERIRRERAECQSKGKPCNGDRRAKRRLGV